MPDPMPLTSVFWRRHKGMLSGFLLGCAAGYAYYYFVGCPSGSCPISAHPVLSTLYAGAIGALLGMKSKNKKH